MADTDETRPDVADHVKPEYLAPVLVDLGTFHDLTQGAGSGDGDGLESVTS